MPHAVVPNTLYPYFQTCDDLDGPIEWGRLFGNDLPVQLDIGCGRGMFLRNSAQSSPDYNWLGLEIDFKEGRYAAKRLRVLQQPNAIVLGCDARIVLESVVPEASVDACHVLFPDPWWKRRHKRRRIFTPEFLELLIRVTKPNHFIHSWTDVSDYWAVISPMLNGHPGLETLPSPPEREPQHDLDYHTGFERKKRQEGETIDRGIWKVLPQTSD